jgi:hypothetical protein
LYVFVKEFNRNFYILTRLPRLHSTFLFSGSAAIFPVSHTLYGILFVNLQAYEGKADYTRRIGGAHRKALAGFII